MGCNLARFFRTKNTGLECLQQIKEVETLLQEMVKKYNRQFIELDADIKRSLRKKEDKALLIHKLRRKKVVLHYIESCRKKMDVLMQKQYAIEQLNITKMQLDALKNSVQLFKQFTKQNSLDKIEDLQDTLQELTDQILDVNSALNEAAPLIDIDDSELESELKELEITLPIFPEAPNSYSDSNNIHTGLQKTINEPLVYT